MSNGSSTGNLNRHLKLHPEKINPEIAKQAELMQKFLQSDKIVHIVIFFYNKEMNYLFIFVLFTGIF
jgi:hypothetical protein